MDFQEYFLGFFSLYERKHGSRDELLLGLFFRSFQLIHGRNQFAIDENQSDGLFNDERLAQNQPLDGEDDDLHFCTSSIGVNLNKEAAGENVPFGAVS